MIASRSARIALERLAVARAAQAGSCGADVARLGLRHHRAVRRGRAVVGDPVDELVAGARNSSGVIRIVLFAPIRRRASRKSPRSRRSRRRARKRACSTSRSRADPAAKGAHPLVDPDDLVRSMQRKLVVAGGPRLRELGGELRADPLQPFKSSGGPARARDGRRSRDLAGHVLGRIGIFVGDPFAFAHGARRRSRRAARVVGRFAAAGAIAGSGCAGAALPAPRSSREGDDDPDQERGDQDRKIILGKVRHGFSSPERSVEKGSAAGGRPNSNQPSPRPIA